MQTHNESSVLFNLQELMRIEHDRVEAEQAAARALEEQARERARQQTAAAERAQAEQRAMELARERAVAEEAARLEVARAVAQEQTRLAMEAAERAARQRMEQQHAEALAALATPARFTWRHGMLIAGVTSAIALLGYFGAIDPMLRQSRALEAQARALADHYAREIEALRQAPVMAPASAVTATDPGPVGVHAVTEPAQERASAKAKRTRVSTRSKGSANTSARVGPLDGDDNDPLDSDDDDPLKGL